MNSHSELIDEYRSGPQLLREAVSGMTEEQLKARPVEGKWSTLEVVCHLADFEPVYANRIKLVVATDNPPLPGGFHDAFAERLGYKTRSVETELNLIDAVRTHMAAVLANLDDDDFARTGLHSESGPLTVETLLQRITGHIPHHVEFIKQKRTALGC